MSADKLGITDTNVNDDYHGTDANVESLAKNKVKISSETQPQTNFAGAVVTVDTFQFHLQHKVC